jgi:hypothetical protein
MAPMTIVSSVVRFAAASVDQKARVKSLMIKSVKPIRKNGTSRCFLAYSSAALAGTCLASQLLASQGGLPWQGS